MGVKCLRLKCHGGEASRVEVFGGKESYNTGVKCPGGEVSGMRSVRVRSVRTPELFLLFLSSIVRYYAH